MAYTSVSQRQRLSVYTPVNKRLPELTVIDTPDPRSVRVVDKPLQSFPKITVQKYRPVAERYNPKITIKGYTPVAKRQGSLGSIFGESFRSGVLQTGSAIETILSVGAKKIGAEQLSQKLSTLSKQDKELSNVGVKVEDTRKFIEKIRDPRYITAGIAQTIPTLLFGMGVAAPAAVISAPALAVGGLAFVGTATLEAGFAYQDAKEFGIDDKTAEKVASIVGVANGILEALPITKLLTRSSAGKKIKRNIIRQITRRVVTQAGLESGTESLQEIVSNAVAMSYDENRKLLQSVPESAFFGGILGGGMSLGMDTFGNEVVKQRVGEAMQSEAGFAKIPFGGQSLIQEAKKFKSADEFVKAQQPIFHGTPAKFEKFNTNISEGGASWFTADKGEILSGKAGAVQSARQKLNVMDRYVKPDLKLATPKQADNLFTDQLIAEGYRGVKYPATKESAEWTKLFNPNEDTLTKSQLTDIWNKANKEKVIKQEVMDKAKQIYDEKVKEIKSAKEIVQRRREFIKAIKKQFGLSDTDLKSITRKDIRLMSNIEFKQFLDDVRIKSEELAVARQVRQELENQIQEKELNIEPLRKALKFPPISQMNSAQLKEFFKELEQFESGDVFLSQRKLETIDRTELAGIKTYREATERLAKKLGINLSELNNIKVSEFDRFRGDASLAERNPFYKMMVEETAKLQLIRDAEFLDIEKETLTLARKMKTTLGEKLIPQQKNVAKWFMAEDKSTVELTEAEVGLVEFMQTEWSQALNYLVEQEALKKGIKSENYFTHVRRGILEAVKEDGVIKAFKEVFNQYKLDEQKFNILDGQTGEVLALDKFFRFAMHRTGTLKPSENIVRAFLTYMRTFKKKQALDEIVPLVDIYAQALTPKGLTKKGIKLHGDLLRFVKEWLNTKKGRRITLLAKQGGKIDWTLRALRTFTTLMDLGLNLTVSVATQVGEQAITYQLLGKTKYALAEARALTKQGRKITAKHRNFIGKNPWTELVEPMKNIGDRLSEGIFILFQDANVRRSRNFLLGSLTKEEFKSGEISDERLTHLRTELGRYGVITSAKSIIGATPEAGLHTQYKTWALPILRTTLQNVINLKTLVQKNKTLGKKSILELYRMGELLFIVFLLRGVISLDEDDDSLFSKLKQRAYMEATTLAQAIDPKLFFSTGRVISFVNDLANNISSIVKMEEYKESRFGQYEEGDLKGLNRLKRQFIPRAVKQFEKDKVKGVSDIKAEILKEIESGKLSITAAKEKLPNEIKKLETSQRNKRYKLSLDDYKAELLKLIESKEMTISEAKEDFVNYSEKVPEIFESEDERTFIEKVSLYARAVGTDPITAFYTLFTDEKIRKLENGTIILYRGKTEDPQKQREFSLKERAERGATKDLKLDHTKPLQLGGSNADSNLKLVSTEEWARYTIIENYLGNQLRQGIIDEKEATDLIIKFKAGELTESDIIK